MAEVLLLGSWPPVPGPATEATVAYARHQLRAGVQVRTAAARPSGADMVERVTGPLAGWRLDRLRRRAAGPGGALGEVVVALTDGVPAAVPASAAGMVAAHLAAWSLAVALRRGAGATLLVAAAVDLPRTALAPLWRAAGTVVVTDASLVGRMGIPAAKVRTVAPGPTLGGLGPPGVTAVGPPEITPLAVPRYTLGVVGRRVLGHRFMLWYTRVLRARNLALRVAGRARRVLRPV